LPIPPGDDDRLPSTGQIVVVDLPRAVGLVRMSVQVVSRIGLRARLEVDCADSRLEAGVPLMLTFGSGRRRVAATVSGNPSPGALDVLLNAPPELRHFRRYPVSLHAEVETCGEPGGLLLSTEIVDLSTKGLHFVVGSGLNVGTEVFTVIDLPTSGPAMAIGDVLECDMLPNEYVYTARMRFTCISDEHLRRISAFLDHLERGSEIVAGDHRFDAPPPTAT
jgi:PilZ domain